MQSETGSDTVGAVTPPEKALMELKAKAYELFLEDTSDLVDVAIALGLKRNQVLRWSKEGGWVQRKLELEREALRAVEMRYREFIVTKRLEVAKQHLKDAGDLQAAIAAVVADRTRPGDDGKPAIVSDMTLKRLAEALSAVTGVSARAVGLSEKPLQDMLDSAEQAADGRKPLVLIGIQGAVRPPAAEEPAINVTVKEAQ